MTLIDKDKGKLDCLIETLMDFEKRGMPLAASLESLTDWELVSCSGLTRTHTLYQRVIQGAEKGILTVDALFPDE